MNKTTKSALVTVVFMSIMLVSGQTYALSITCAGPAAPTFSTPPFKPDPHDPTMWGFSVYSPADFSSLENAIQFAQALRDAQDEHVHSEYLQLNTGFGGTIGTNYDYIGVNVPADFYNMYTTVVVGFRIWIGVWVFIPSGLVKLCTKSGTVG